jgi:septum site-determining protein MinC
MAEEAVSIKGTRNGLVIIFNPNLDLEEIKAILKSKMENSKGFFRGAKFVVYNSGSGRDHHYVRELEGICRHYGLIPSQDVTWPPEGAGLPAVPPPAKRKKDNVISLRLQPNPEGDPALLVTRTLRSGQKISSCRSIVVLGDVNPGAEVFSENSVYVLGSCKGSVHAGSAGNLMSEIVALKLQPVILRIGSITGETPPAGAAGPIAARVSRGKIVYGKL